MQAKLVRTDEGLVPEGEGWYVLNAREARWFHSDEFGSACTFEGDIRFPEFGINIGVGPTRCLTTRRLPRRTSSSSPANACCSSTGKNARSASGTSSTALPVPSTCSSARARARRSCWRRARGEGKTIVYPVSELAQRYGASAEQETPDPKEAYARFDKPSLGPAPELP